MRSGWSESRSAQRERRLNGKSDLLDAHNAARAVLAGTAKATPKSADGVVEMLRQIKVAKDTAVKARTSAMITLKALIVNVEPELREQLQPLPKMALIDRCAGFAPVRSTPRSPLRSTPFARSRGAGASCTPRSERTRSCSSS